MARQKKLYDNKETVTAPVVEPLPEVAGEKKEAPVRLTRAEVDFGKFIPKTDLGKKVKSGEITSIKQVFEQGYKIREAEVVDKLLPGLKSDFILIGQSHGKFGGGKRRLIKQTQKKTAEGNSPAFTALAVIGNGDGYFGVGRGTAKESIPAKEKALREAKTNLIQVPRGCGSWKCGCGEPHSLPFKIEGKSGSVWVKLMPAPKGAGLVTEDEVKKILSAAGYKDIWSKSIGQTRKKINFINAVVNAIYAASRVKVKQGIPVKYGALAG